MFVGFLKALEQNKNEVRVSSHYAATSTLGDGSCGSCGSGFEGAYVRRIVSCSRTRMQHFHDRTKKVQR